EIQASARSGRSAAPSKSAGRSRGRQRKPSVSELEQIKGVLVAHRSRLASLLRQVRAAERNGDSTGARVDDKMRLVADLGGLAQRVDLLGPRSVPSGTREQLMKDILSLYSAAKR